MEKPFLVNLSVLNNKICRHQTGQYRKLTDASKSGCFSFRNYALAVSKSYSFFPSYT